MTPPEALPPAIIPLPSHVAPAAPPERAEPPPTRRAPLRLIAFVAAFAALLASFPARNPDVLMHLATGRDLAAGSLRWAAPAAELRPHATWLADLSFYIAHQAAGGPALVAFKALVVVALGLILFRRSAARHAYELAALCTALALLTMSTRLLLQPATLSYLMLALALANLGPTSDAPDPPAPAPRWPWPTYLVFLAWVNLDTWFLLGLPVVALAWLGQALDDAQGRARALGRRALWLAGLAAVCLANPSFSAALAPPADWRLLGLAGSPAALLAGPTLSPFQASYFGPFGRSPAGLAYFALLGLSALSFLLNRPSWRWRWLLPWLGLALFSAAQARAIPFFAVVAGPVLAWNLGQAFVRHPGAVRPGLWRSLAFALAPALLVAAWPGWLQAPPYEPRRWAFSPSPALEQAAREAPQWRQQGRLEPADAGLHLAPESAFAFAWWLPESRSLYDPRLTAALAGAAPVPPDAEQTLRAAGVKYLVVQGPDRPAHSAVLNRLLLVPERSPPLLHVRGDVALFAWGPGAAPAQRLDLDRLAFRPDRTQRAPAAGPDEAPRRWFDALRRPAPARPVPRDEAVMFLALADAWRLSAPRRHLIDWEAGQLAGLVGAPAGWAGPAGPVDGALRLALFRPPLPPPDSPARPSPLSRALLNLARAFAAGRDDSPSALLYLAVRAARRALAESPADARAHLALGEAYLRLLHNTRERAWAQRLPELLELRRTQAAEALHQALAHQPNLAEAHLQLAALYQEMNHLDLELRHRRAYLTLLTRAGPPPGADPQAFRDQLDRAQEGIDRLARTVAERQQAFDAETATGARVLDRARLASQFGLAGQALDILLASDLAAFGADGMALQLDLQLRTGRAREVRDWTYPEMKGSLGERYHWLRAQAFAAAGDYAAARQECALLASGGRAPNAPGPRQLIAIALGRGVLEADPSAGQLVTLLVIAIRQTDLRPRVASLARAMRQEADATVLGGLLALEQGDADGAERDFIRAASYWQGPDAFAAGGTVDFAGRPIAVQGLEWLR